jgi:hypothetical protein
MAAIYRSSDDCYATVQEAHTVPLLLLRPCAATVRTNVRYNRRRPKEWAFNNEECE